MKNASELDVERVKNGEFVPNVMFNTLTGMLVHMKEISVQGIFGGWRLEEGQKIFETDCGKLIIVHTDNLLPIKKHAFSSNASKKIKRNPVKGSRKYVKVACKQAGAIALAKRQGWITFITLSGKKVKRYLSKDTSRWEDSSGFYQQLVEWTEESYEYMYVPVEISPRHQATISTTLSKSINQMVEDAKLGEVMRKAGWKINEWKMPCSGSFLVEIMRRDGSTWNNKDFAVAWKWDYLGVGSDIIAYRIVE